MFKTFFVLLNFNLVKMGWLDLFDTVAKRASILQTFAFQQMTVSNICNIYYQLAVAFYDSAT